MIFNCSSHCGSLTGKGIRRCTRMSQDIPHRSQASPPVSSQTCNIRSFEDLNRVVPSARTEVTQIDAGRLCGELTHFRIGDLPLDIGTFSHGVRSQGVVSEDRITIGMLTSRAGRVTHWSYEMQPGDVVVWLPKGAHDARYYGGASVAVISLSASDDLASIFGSEPGLQQPGAWGRNHYRPEAGKGAENIIALQGIVGRLKHSGTLLNAEAAEFWKRAVVDVMTSTIVNYSPSDRNGPRTSALRVVGKVEEYLETNGLRPVHISEICGELGFSRRTLHRAFNEAIGLGPTTFLRRRR